jgi:hypothetical protein
MAKKSIVIVSPKSVDTQAYEEFLPGATDMKVDDHWMNSIRAYNRMMISPLLYNSLPGYTHMLLHEPDAILLSDQLEDWCAQPYDYIGAPWVNLDHSQYGGNIDNPHVNGGLSLCNLETMRFVTSSWKRWHSLRVRTDLLAGFTHGDWMRVRKALLVIYPGGLLRGAYLSFPWNWDKFFFSVVPALIPEFRIAPPSVRVSFSWEFGYDICMKINQGRLPFGVHAWAKYDFKFLKSHLLDAGVDLSPIDRIIDPQERQQLGIH